ncbi:MAG TPA: glycoside hydrolase family 44 protein, partial [Longimicrobiaceae bacterium]|nr:glycoside hydrolase family 44 protein [Longimicrobiaceae bacterium]
MPAVSMESPSRFSEAVPSHPCEPRTRRAGLSVTLAALALALAACSGGSLADPLTPSVPVEEGKSSLTPDDPGVADVRFTLDSSIQTPISRFIYGVNSYEGWDGIDLPANLTLGRQGGNRASAYNWENNASNAGSDWNYQNDAWMGGGDVPGEAIRSRVAGTLAKGAGIIVTVPMMGYVAADKKGPVGTSEATLATRLATRFRESRARKGSAFSLRPDVSDRYVYQDEFVWWLNQTFPGAAGDPVRPIFYSLDNEPDLWHGTHEEVRSAVGGKPNLLTYGELVGKTVEHAAAIKDVVPGAQVFGPGVATWSGATTLGRWPTPDPVAGKVDFLDYYLTRMREAERTHGRRLLDVLDLHWYAEGTAEGRKVSDDHAPQTPAMVQARVQSTRSLWDPSYTEKSWVVDVTGGPIRLLPRLREKIAAHYPGTKIAISEYYFGRAGDISGGIAQADALGIFGREGVFAATLWPCASLKAYGGDGNRAYAYAFGAFRMFRDYDGRGGSFGDTGISAATSNTAGTSVYASVDAGRPGRVVVVAINKTGAPVNAGISLAHTRLLRRAEVYTMTDGSPRPTRGADISISKRNAFVYAMPPMSVTTLVLMEQ